MEMDDLDVFSLAQSVEFRNRQQNSVKMDEINQSNNQELEQKEHEKKKV